MQLCKTLSIHKWKVYYFLRLSSSWTGRITSSGYKPSEIEGRSRLSNIERELPPDAPKFRMILPPPNVTGHLHLGHAFMATIQDTMCRWKRLQGYNVEWIPGTDHAGIATQVVVENKLMREKGVSRHDIGREKFLEEVWKWKEEKAESIIDELKNLGCSLNYENEYFTMDSVQSKAVTEAFISLFEAGLIERRKSIVNWSCALESTISDIEVDTIEIKGPTAISVPGYDNKVMFGKLYEVAYKIIGSNEEIVVCTTRPETILGDVAIAVHPLDERYSHMRERSYEVWHPFRKEPIPVIFDLEVDKEFGTGAVKITPAHDKLDLEIGNRHRLDPIQVFLDNGTVGNFEGFNSLRRFDARCKILDALTSLNLLRGVKDHEMKIPICSRSKDILEYMVRDQWFMNCKQMAESALHAVKSGKLQLFPSDFEYEWEKWLTDNRDWCISRQLWWGHQIPAYSFEHESKVFWVAANSEDEASVKMSHKLKVPVKKFSLKRDPDVLDTWFSSGLLPFTVNGWPVKTEFEPLDVMETGHDILFFWVARMVMLSQSLTGKLPFKYILLNGIVCDAHGRKMSKSLGNVIRPKQVIYGKSLEDLQSDIMQSAKEGVMSQFEIEKSMDGVRRNFPRGIPECGKDALRFTFLQYNLKNHFINFDVNECYTNRLFFNKIWQATKYLCHSMDKLELTTFDMSSADLIPSKMDKWILSKLSRTVDLCISAYDSNRFHLVVNAMKQFLYSNVCDVYIETTKSAMSKKDDKSINHCKTLGICLTRSLQIMSPITPFLSNELLRCLPVFEERNLDNYMDDVLEEDFKNILEICKLIRHTKSQNKISRKHEPILYLFPSNRKAEQLLRNFSEEVKLLTQCVIIKIAMNANTNEMTIYSTAGHLTTYGIQTNQSYKTNNSQLNGQNSQKEMKIQQDLEKLLITVGNDGYQKSANDKVKQKHLERIKQLKNELEAIRQFNG